MPAARWPWLLLSLLCMIPCRALTRIPLSLQQQQRDVATVMLQQERTATQLSRLPLPSSEFVGEVAVGTPPQSFQMLLDSGSSDAWLLDVSCLTCGLHARFDRQLSQSFKALKESFHGAYGSGDSYGEIRTDVFAVGNLSVSNQALAVVRVETGGIPRFAGDGVLGLAFAGMSKIPHETLLDGMLKANPEMEPMFAFHLSGDPQQASEFHFGGYDLSVAGEKASLALFPVLILPRDYELTCWTIAVHDFHLVHSTSTSKHQSSNLCDRICYAIVDTGSSFTYVPAQLYASVVAEIVDGKLCDLEQLTCDGVGYDSFPTLSFSFGSIADGNFFQLTPRSYLDCHDGSCETHLLNHGMLGDDKIWWVLGDNFIQAYYTVFDFQKLEIGFACSGSSPNCSTRLRSRHVKNI